MRKKACIRWAVELGPTDSGNYGNIIVLRYSACTASHSTVLRQSVWLLHCINQLNYNSLVSAFTQIVSRTISNKSQVVGSAYYTAPEVLGGSYDYRCDVWSLVRTFALLHILFQPPWQGSSFIPGPRLVWTHPYTRQLPVPYCFQFSVWSLNCRV